MKTSKKLALTIFIAFGMISMTAGLSGQDVLGAVFWATIFAASCSGVTWALASEAGYTAGLKDAEAFAGGIDIFKDDPSASFPVLQVDYQDENGGYAIIMIGQSWNTGVKIAIVPNTSIVGWKPGDPNPTHAGLDASGEKVLLSRHLRK